MFISGLPKIFSVRVKKKCRKNELRKTLQQQLWFRTECHNLNGMKSITCESRCRSGHREQCWPLGGSTRTPTPPPLEVRRAPRSHCWNVMLCSPKPSASLRGRGARVSAPAPPFALKAHRRRDGSSFGSDAFILSETARISGLLSSTSRKLDAPVRVYLRHRQPASDKLCGTDTEWREADAPLLSGPLTLFPEPFLMPSRPACCATAGRAYVRGSFVTVRPPKSWLFSPSSSLLDTLTALLRTMRKGMAPLRRRRPGLQSVFYVCLSISLSYSYNIDLEHPLVFRGPNSSFFGYSVLEHFHDNTRWWVPFCTLLFCQRCNTEAYLGDPLMQNKTWKSVYLPSRSRLSSFLCNERIQLNRLSWPFRG